MQVIRRNMDLKNNVDISQEKIKITLLWIYEFKFTNAKIVEILLDLDGRHVRPFLKKLVEKEFISLFKNKNLDGKITFMRLLSWVLSFLKLMVC
jgi:hypothetical protein